MADHRFSAYDHYGVLGAAYRMHTRAERYLSQILAETLGSDQPCAHDKTSHDCPELDCWHAGRLAAEVARLSRPLADGRDIAGPAAQALTAALTALNTRYDRLYHVAVNHQAYVKHARGSVRSALNTSERKGPQPWK